MGIIPVIVVGILLLVLGGYFFLSQKGSLVPISTSPTPTTDPTANWKIYTNTKVGFQFKFPSRYQDPRIVGTSKLANGSENNVEVLFGVEAKDLTTLGDYVTLGIRSYPGTIDDLIKEISDKESRDANSEEMTVKINEISVNNIKAVSLTRNINPGSTDQINFYEVYLVGKGYALDFLGNNERELSQILSTFQFID